LRTSVGEAPQRKQIVYCYLPFLEDGRYQ
jgi:hypothetical protein